MIKQQKRVLIPRKFCQFKTRSRTWFSLLLTGEILVTKS